MTNTEKNKPFQIPSFKFFTNLSRKIQAFASDGVPRKKFMVEVSKIITSFIKPKQLEIWVQDNELRYCCVSEQRKDYLPSFHIIKHDEFNFENSDFFEPFQRKICRNFILDKINPTTLFYTNKNQIVSYGEDEKIFDKINLDLKDMSELENRTMIFIPFIIEEKNRGLLYLCFAGKDVLNSTFIDFLEGLAQVIGSAILARRAQSAHKERIKELTCLYGICRIFKHPSISKSFILRHIVKLLPPAMQYPEIAFARICYENKTYETPGIPEDGHLLSSDIIIDGVKRGSVQVVYKTKYDLGSSIFLQEEQSLLDSIARQLVFVMEAKLADEKKTDLENQLRHADRIATIGQLSAGFAHELNEPLSSILGFAQLIQKSEEISGQVSKDLDKIIKSAFYARNIVKKLLIFARQMPPASEQVDINDVIKDVVGFFEKRFEKENIQLVTSFYPDIPLLNADYNQLRQVIVNLIVNSLQAMPEGGVLAITTCVKNSEILIIVEDSGVGIANKIKDKIFDPFFTTKEPGEGTGLGLAVVHGIVASHGGKINVESDENVGTTFTISLPIRNLQNKKA